MNGLFTRQFACVLRPTVTTGVLINAGVIPVRSACNPWDVRTVQMCADRLDCFCIHGHISPHKPCRSGVQSNNFQYSNVHTRTTCVYVKIILINDEEWKEC